MMLEAIKWIQGNTDVRFEVALHVGGQLLEVFREEAPTVVLNPFLGSPSWGARVARTLIRNPQTLDRLLAARFRRRIRAFRPEAIWLNSVASWKAADAVAPEGIPRVLHVHELENIIRLVGPPKKPIASMADHFVAVSGPVRENLMNRHGIDPEAISTVHSAVPRILVRPLDEVSRKKGRSRLGIGPEDLVLVGCGVGSLAKGFDLIPALLSKLRGVDDLPPIHLIWVGRLDASLPSSVWADLDSLGVADILHLPGEVDDPKRFFAIADISVLLSREEALGLVCLEAAQCSLPTVCFAEAGGAPEFVENDAGRVVPYLDLDAFAAAIVEMAGDPVLRYRLGDRARRKVEYRYTIDFQAPRLIEVFNQLDSEKCGPSVLAREASEADTATDGGF